MSDLLPSDALKMPASAGRQSNREGGARALPAQGDRCSEWRLSPGRPRQLGPLHPHAASSPEFQAGVGGDRRARLGVISRAPSAEEEREAGGARHPVLGRAGTTDRTRGRALGDLTVPGRDSGAAHGPHFSAVPAVTPALVTDT